MESKVNLVVSALAQAHYTHNIRAGHEGLERELAAMTVDGNVVPLTKKIELCYVRQNNLLLQLPPSELGHAFAERT